MTRDFSKTVKKLSDVQVNNKITKKKIVRVYVKFKKKIYLLIN